MDNIRRSKPIVEYNRCIEVAGFDVPDVEVMAVFSEGQDLIAEVE